MKYMRKALIVEAILCSEMNSALNKGKLSEICAWAYNAVMEGVIVDNDGKTEIETLEGSLIAQPDDMIVRGIKGELYPVKLDIFAESYVPMDGEPETMVASIPESMGGHAEEETPPPIGNFPILKFFEFEHLPEHLQKISKPFHNLAYDMTAGLQPSAELSAGLRKLLEAKDCIVRASLT